MVPALFTKISGEPTADNTASYSRSAPSGWLRSAAKLCDLPPRARIAWLVSSAGRRFPWHATDAPASASATAMAAPSPVAEPVTSASFPSRRNLSRIPIVYRRVFFGVASRLSTSPGCQSRHVGQYLQGLYVRTGTDRFPACETHF